MASPPLTDEEVLLLAEAIEADPVWFATDWLGHDHWEMPQRILHALTRPRARVAVKACHSSAKTFTAADAVLWWVACGGVVITTAPTWTQVDKLLWGALRTTYATARVPIGGRLLKTELRLGPESYAMGLSTNEGVRFQGWHGKVLIVLDEAPGVLGEIWEAIEGIRAGGDVRVLALGNPTIASGPFYDAFTSQRATWQTFTIDAFATPNLAGLTPALLRELPEPELDIAPRPYLTTRRWVREKLEDWGEESPLWLARVRGQFPPQTPDALISLAWIEAAASRTTEPAGDDVCEAGIDVAGPGESETVLSVRLGAQVVLLRGWTEPDPRGAVLEALAPYKDRLALVKVDSVGQGYYFARHLEDHGYAGRVAYVNVGLPSSDPERYANLKAELYWGLRDRLRTGDLAGLTDERTHGQLASIRYRQNARGQVVIEPKEQAAKRGVPSPDRAESLMLCYGALPAAPADEVWVYEERVEISPY